MNILEHLTFGAAKPATYIIYQSDKTKYMAIGLLQDQILKKHQAKVPTMLTLLKGQIEFHINDQVILLKAYDTYQIPVFIEHEVKGIDPENVFTLMQEKG